MAEIFYNDSNVMPSISIMDHPYQYNDCLSINKLIDLLRDMSFRISTLEEENKRLANRISVLEQQELPLL
jgi:hypothetical protein